MAPYSSSLAWENPMDRGAWEAVVHGVAEGQTQLSDFTFTFHFHALEKEMATTPVFLPGESQDRGAWWEAVYGVTKSQTGLSDFTFTFHFHALEKEMATTPVFLPGESQGWGSLVGCRLWSCTGSDTTEAT